MTIKQAQLKYPDIETNLFLSHILSQTKEFLYINPEQKLTSTQASRLNKMVTQRKQGIPAAYILGFAYFMGEKFKVSRKVLIPRPETEWLANKAIAYAKTLKNPSIVDVGTGSGIIAISLAKNLPEAKVWATDISKQALNVAKTNAKKHKVEISFKNNDLLKGVSTKFDLIVANLPYVPHSDYQKLKANLRYEPKIAITDETDTGEIILKLLSQAQTKLKPKGKILLEIDPSNEKTIRKWIKQHQELSAKFYKDLRGLVRYCIIQS